MGLAVVKHRIKTISQVIRDVRAYYLVAYKLVVFKPLPPFE